MVQNLVSAASRHASCHPHSAPSTSSLQPQRCLQQLAGRRAVAKPSPPFARRGLQQLQAAQRPLDDDEGAKMVQLDAESYGSLDGSSETPFGPLAVLAVGFTQLEFERLRRLLHEEMDAEMVKVIPAPAAAWGSSLGAALELDPVPQFEQAPLGTRRVLFLSGMFAAEVMETISAVREAGLPEAVFAAAVPNNYARPLAELVQEVFADHQAMRQQRQAAAAAAAAAQGTP